MNQQVQLNECLGVRDLNQFIKGLRNLERENGQPVYYPPQNLNFMPEYNPNQGPINQQFSQRQAIMLEPLQQLVQPPQPLDPPEPRIRDNMGYLACCFFPTIYLIISLLRITWVFVAFFLPGGILWIISDVIFIVAFSFICCNLKSTLYKAMLIIFAISVVIDIAGLIYSSIYFGVYVTSISIVDENKTNVCTSSTIDSAPSSTGYYYGLDYESETSVVYNCVGTSNINIGHIWVIILCVASAIIYCNLSCLLYYTHRAQGITHVAPIFVPPQAGMIQ